MTLTPGTRLGPYEVIAQIGVGGMGEVYRATDTNLKRAVAIKVLPSSVAGDAERLTRFQREAEVLAALNHPNIAQIHGLEKSDGTIALVMELVEGDTLADRIARGPVPLDEALPIAMQIAEALEVAHEQGIIHRDLKPANIKVRPDGTVKVLDFGLAKALSPAEAGHYVPNRGVRVQPDLSQAPTITSPAMMTGAGMILGTAAYMSPEQARGRPVDKRTDIWAFGCVLFEMLTGQRAFGGAEVVDTIASVVGREPDWSTLPTSMPPSTAHLLRRCLDKDPKRRLRDVGEARLELEGSLEPRRMSERTSEAVVRPRVRRAVPILIAAAAGVAIATCVAALRSVPPSLDEPTVRMTVQPNQVFGNPGVSELALSPDGRHLAFVDRGRTGKTLWIHALDTGEVRELPGTDGAWYPFWSPDGRSVGFYDTPGDIGSVNALRRVPASGGPVQTITEVTTAAGATWNEAGVIVFGGQAGGLLRVPAAGGTPEPLTAVDDSATEISHRFPQFLPGGTHLLYFVSAENPEQHGLYVRSVDADDATRVLATEAPGVFVSPGYILTVRDETLLAYPFDVETMAVAGGAVAIADGVGRGSFPFYPGITASRNGVLAYGSALGIGSTQLTWSDRTGRRLGSVGSSESVIQVRLSPDETRALLLKRDPRTNLNDIWVTELTTQVSTPLAGDGGDPIWSPDGRRVAFYARRGAVRGVYEKPVGGGDEKLLLAGTGNTEDWTRDGSSILIRQAGVPFLLPLSGTPTPSQLMPQAPFGRNQFHVSPSGKWIAYTSNESDTTEVWVASFPSFAESRQVSRGGGDVPRWRGDERELYYLAPDGAMMSVGITVGSGIQAGPPTRLFQTRILGSGGFDRYDVASDGQRFLLLEPPESASAPPITVVTNWTSLLRR